MYQGDYTGTGRPRKFDGKVDIDVDLARLEKIESLSEGVEVYSAVLYSTHLKRNIRVVLLKQTLGQKAGKALLFSTDLELDSRTLIRYYKARF